MSVCAVVGGQFGSEGKGLITGHIARQYNDHVRVGAANAGHTVYDIDGHKRVMQQIPCAAYTNPDAGLWIGPGALISSHIFMDELEKLEVWRELKGLDPPLINMDPRAHVITNQQIDREGLTDLAERIGSTSTIAKEGIGIAQSDRVMRAFECMVLEDTPIGQLDTIQFRDVPMALADRCEGVKPKILLEGTQGAGLSLTTGRHPYITSRNTTSAGLAADCGIAPNRLERVILVCRTFPIRVAGNSGPFFGDSVEIAWGDIGIDPENERTTVTKKIRRVATFSLAQVEEAVVLNGATEIALTFADYECPGLAGVTSFPVGALDGLLNLQRLIAGIEDTTNTHVSMVGTGPNSVIDRSL